MKVQVPGMLLKLVGEGSFMYNCYIVGSEAAKEALLIDAGAILEEVKGAGLVVKQIVLLTPIYRGKNLGPSLRSG